MPSSCAPLVLTVLPPEEPVEARMAIPGERVVFLVAIDDLDPADGPVEITATGDGVTVEGEQPFAAPAAGEVREIAVSVGPEQTERTVSVTFTAHHGAPNEYECSERRTIGVMPWNDDRQVAAEPYLDRWVGWLAAAHPELGLTPETEWEPFYVLPVLIVSHYAYWNEDWEMVVSWHIMVAPDDFTEVRLRRRDIETSYGLAFRQDSYANDTEPHAIDGGELMR